MYLQQVDALQLEYVNSLIYLMKIIRVAFATLFFMQYDQNILKKYHLTCISWSIGD